MSRRGKHAPYPFDVLIGGTGWMLAVDTQGKLAWDEGTVDQGGPEGAGTQRHDTWRDEFSGGFGLRRDSGSAEAKRMLYYSRVADGGRTKLLDGTNVADQLGGGVDPRFGALCNPPFVQPSAGPVQFPNPAGAADLAVRTFCAFQSQWYAAVGPYIYRTATLHADTVGHWTLVFTSAFGPVVDLLATNLRKGGPELEVATRYGPRYVSTTGGLGSYVVDGTTRNPDGSTKDTRDGTPTAIYFWDQSAGTPAGAGQFFDATPVLTADPSGPGQFDLSLMQTADYLLFGYRSPWAEFKIDMGGHQNSGAATLILERWNGTGWDLVPGVADGTTDGASFAHDGSITWPEQSTETWIPAVLATNLQGEQLFFMRVRFTAAFDDDVKLHHVGIGFRYHVQAFAQTRDRLAMVVDNSRIVFTAYGGTDGEVTDTSDHFAPPSSFVLGAAVLVDTVYVRTKDGIYSTDQDGKPRELAPTLKAQPAIDEWHGFGAWLNHLYAANGPELVQLAADGGLQAVGPERLTLSDGALQFRCTALQGDRDHFLYGAFQGSDGKAYWLSWGIYRRITNPQSGVEEWARMDAWAVIGDLEGRTVSAIGAFVEGDQPTQLFGDTAGGVFYADLPRGFSPLEPHSGASYANVDAEAWFPSFDGYDPTRAVTAFRVHVRGRAIDAARRVEVLTKTPAESAWTSRGTLTSEGAIGFGDAPHVGLGLDLKLVLRTQGSHASTHLVDGLGLWYRQAILSTQRRWSLTLQAHDRVKDRQGKRLPRTTEDWQTLALATQDTPSFPLVTPLGRTFHVAAEAFHDAVARPARDESPQAALAIVLSSAE